MRLRLIRSSVTAALALAAATLQAAAPPLTKQQADLFSQKVAQIALQGESVQKPGTHRTPVSETELNSWFTYAAKPLLPAGVADPRIAMLGNGKLTGEATVDLDAIAKKKTTGGGFDLWSLLSGKVPVNVAGTLHTKDGTATFNLESANINGVPVPKPFLQQLVSYYSRTPKNPQGVSIDDAFMLPAAIRQIDVGTGQAVIVQ
jgi:hypothetical protein